MAPNTETDLPCSFAMKGKAVRIAGGTSGIGRVGAARCFVTLVLHGRRQQVATEPMLREFPGGGSRVRGHRFANRRSVRRCRPQPDHRVVYPQVEKCRKNRVRQFSYVFEPF